MSAPPPVTVAVPTIGRLEYCSALRRSIEAQTFGDFEVLILDNESPEASREAFADWARADSRVRIERTSPRVSMFANFDRARTLGRGEFLGFCHDDDVYLPRYVEASVELLRREPGVGLVGSNNDFIDEHDRLTERRRWIGETHVMPGRSYIRFVMSRGRNLVPMQGVFYRKNAIGPAGFDDSVSCHFGDFVVLMRIAERHDVGLVAEPLLRVRRHVQQTSNSMDLSTGLALRAQLMSRYLNEFEATWPQDHYFARALRRDLARSVRIGALWGWLSAPTREEADGCRATLRGAGLDKGIDALLRGLDGAGASPALRRHLVPVVREVANRLRL